MIFLSWIDYALIALTLIISTVVGSIFAFFKKSDNAAAEYLDGGQNLKIVPVTISICASVVSSVGILGVVAEMYEFGPHHLIGTVLIILSAIVALKVYIPVFYNLKITSMYEYLEMRFDNRIRRITSALFILEAILVASTVSYCSSLALAKMSGINIHLINVISCGICILYTMLGGIKGVIWTDTLQAWIMIVSMLAIITVAVNKVGGVGEVFNVVSRTNHLELSYSFSPFVRYSVPIAILGTWWMFLGMCFITQSNIQRFNALPDLPSAKKACIYVAIGSIILLGLSHICGLVLHALYADCDPVVTRQVHKTEEILPHFIIEYTLKYPGFAGTFLAGLLSAGLSTISAKLNSASGVLYHDFVKKFFGDTLHDSTITFILKTGVIVVGLISLFMGFAIDHLGQIIQLSMSLQSICYGPILGLYTLGILVPQCNVKGAYAGAISGLVILIWLTIGNQVAVTSGTLSFTNRLGTTIGCTDFNHTGFNETVVDAVNEEPFILFQLSFIYYSLFGTICTIVIGYVVSYLTEFEDLMKLNPNYVAPCLQEWLKAKQKQVQDPEVVINLLNKN